MSNATLTTITVLMVVMGSTAMAQNQDVTLDRDPLVTNPQKAKAIHQTAQKTEQVILGRIARYESELQAAAKKLEDELARAEAIRQLGLKENKQELLQQAEQLERQAMTRYTRSIQNFDKQSSRLEENTKSRSAPTVNSDPPLRSRRQLISRPPLPRQRRPQAERYEQVERRQPLQRHYQVQRRQQFQRLPLQRRQPAPAAPVRRPRWSRFLRRN